MLISYFWLLYWGWVRKWQKLSIPSVGEDVEQEGVLYNAGGNVHWHNHFGKSGILY